MHIPLSHTYVQKIIWTTFLCIKKSISKQLNGYNRISSLNALYYKGYLHSTTRIHSFLIELFNVKQNKALCGRTFWVCCFRALARFRVIVDAVAAPIAVSHAVLRGLAGPFSGEFGDDPPSCPPDFSTVWLEDKSFPGGLSPILS